MKKLFVASSRRYGKGKLVAQTMFSLRDPQGLRASLTRVMWLAVMLATGKRIGRVAARTRRFNHILQLTMRIARYHGVGVAIKFLKACHVALMRFVGGSPLSSLRKVEKGLPLYRLSNGLPTCIGTSDRAAIRRKDPGVIRLYMTIFGLYRVLSGPLNPKLETITMVSEASISAVTDFTNFLFTFWPIWSKKFNFKLWLRPKSGRPPISTSAGPNSSNGLKGILTDAVTVYHSDLRDTMVRYAQYAGLTKWIGWLGNCVTIAESLPYSTEAKTSVLHSSTRLGQLSFKPEAAGKLRVFAIVDFWTQWLFAGLHESIMSSLAKVPMDGTKSHSDIAYRASLIGKEKGAWSVDISAATDRIPLLIQEGLLNIALGSFIGSMWASILRDRDYIIPSNDYGIEEGAVRYGAGQPMGARSSWPMLALTHHMLVQWAAEGAGVLKGKPFEDYEIIGDDLVVHNHEVYLQYLRNAKRLAYGISEAKSLPSPKEGVVEIAKQVLSAGVSLSSVALKQLLASMRSLSGRTQNVLYFARLGLVPNPGAILAILARSKEDYLRSQQKYSAGKANSLICLLTATAGSARLAESVEFLADPLSGGGGTKVPVQRILLYVERLLLDGDAFIEPDFHRILHTRSVVHAMCDKLLNESKKRVEKLYELRGAHYSAFARAQLVRLAPGRVYPKIASVQQLPLASLIIALEQDLPDIEEELTKCENWLAEIPRIPASSVLPRMVNLPAIRRQSNEMLKSCLELFDRVIAIENRANLTVPPRVFIQEYGWLPRFVRPLSRAQKAMGATATLSGRPKSKWVGTW